MASVDEISQFNFDIEAEGRLRYINEGWNSILFHPSKIGLPVLNGMYFGPNIDQEIHTHPEWRFGMVWKGCNASVCSNEDEIFLNEGDLLIVPSGAPHAFRTRNDGIVFISFHPSSSTGPTDLDNFMLNGTEVHGKPVIESKPDILTG